MAALRILCADDNQFVLNMLGDVLRRADHEVEFAGDGMSALGRLAVDPKRFHLIITDNLMPRLNGLGLVAKAQELGYKGKFIVFGSPLNEADRQRYAELGVDRIVDKPDPANLLLAAVTAIAQPNE